MDSSTSTHNNWTPWRTGDKEHTTTQATTGNSLLSLSCCNKRALVRVYGLTRAGGKRRQRPLKLRDILQCDSGNIGFAANPERRISTTSTASAPKVAACKHIHQKPQHPNDKYCTPQTLNPAGSSPPIDGFSGRVSVPSPLSLRSSEYTTAIAPTLDSSVLSCVPHAVGCVVCGAQWPTGRPPLVL
jgi:hypothetical protein